MTNNESLYNTTPIMESDSVDFPMSPAVRFWFLIIFEIPSTACAIFVLLYIFIDRKLRTSVNNHALAALLITGLPVQLIDVPLYLNFIVHSYVVSASPLLCLTWIFADYGLYQLELALMTWIAFERHIIVFHDHLLSTQKKRILFHYVPMMILIIYTLTFYIYVIYFYPCENTYDYTLPYCGVSACYLDYLGISMWDLSVNGIIPAVLEICFSLSFLARVIWQRYRTRLRIQWRKQRKMTLQLMSISTLNYTLNVSSCIILIMHASGVPPDVGELANEYISFFMYLLVFIIPFICLVSVGNAKKLLKEKIFSQRSRVRPTKDTFNRQILDQNKRFQPNETNR